MNFAVFAADEVGLKVVQFLGSRKEQPKALIVDRQDSKGLNAQFTAALGNVPFLRVGRTADRRTLSKLKEMELDLIILAWWPYLLSREIIRLPKWGCLNFHPGYLPYNRGKHPNFWSIVEDTPFGVSLHFVNSEIDAGPIAFQKPIKKTWEDTGQSLYEKSKEEILALFKEKFERIQSGKMPRKKQNLKSGSFHKAVEIDSASRIDLNRYYKARHLLNILRARTFPPYPAAWFVDGKEKYEIFLSIQKIKT